MKRFTSELIGTFAMIFFGCGAMAVNEVNEGILTHPGVAIVWGLVVMVMIYAFAEISGAHFNPAVTVAFAFAKKFKWREVPAYITAQLVGAIMACVFLKYLFPESVYIGATIPTITPIKAFLLEFILTYFLILVIINVSTGSKEIGPIAGIAIGSVILLEAMFAGPLTKASMNPTRSLAPALVTGNLSHIWLYLSAPFVGGVFAVWSCRLLKTEGCCDQKC